MSWPLVLIGVVLGVILVLQYRTYLMVKYLSGGRSWKRRFKTIKDKFARMRRVGNG